MKTVISKSIELEPVEIVFNIQKSRGSYTTTLTFIEKDEETCEQSFIKVNISEDDLDMIKRKIDKAYKD
jgi:hypothetical protein